AGRAFRRPEATPSQPPPSLRERGGDNQARRHSLRCAKGRSRLSASPFPSLRKREEPIKRVAFPFAARIERSRASATLSPSLRECGGAEPVRAAFLSLSRSEGWTSPARARRFSP